ncbi:heparinase II/III family protein [Amycolatopsis acidiphila]|uniref:Heparinase n=1 Tax=Amycolatopsis acidiphila TaxID=715473 RepID=A0A558A5R8_9PSEU|nr:alginate lyase family protein [Amycolatopsis acidiphila]TVT19613.1 heparinase [Amycolatopsis acidiphila]UIJ64187.1 heparinase II/III family protein [Amycolatopsis acidiphila]
MGPGWYLRRLSRMGPQEIRGRAADVVRKRRWRRIADAPSEAAWLGQRDFTTALPPDALGTVPREAADAVIAAADRLFDGHAEYFGVSRDDMVGPDWSFDPKTGRRAPTDLYSFDIAYRSEDTVGDIKQIWEPSRHQHLTVLAAAYASTGEDHYAERVADHLKSWWAANPPLRGVHWVSGIELGIRLLSWVWTRRLLDGWAGAPGLFEDNPEALHQIWHHQRWLAAFPSRGSSANNHAIAEAAGQLAAACAFPWFPESMLWRTQATSSLDEHLARNTFESGLNRELATEYHGLVLELGLAAALEAEAAGTPVPESTWQLLLRMTDALASIVDDKSRPPRQGDADDGYGLIVDGAGADRWASLLATGAALFGRLDWWPVTPRPDVRTSLLAALAESPKVTVARPERRPSHFADAGLTILRDGEIWCRCDGGPHGFLSIAAHAHADALSVEVRHNGVDILADPGTFCYHGQPAWRSYFRSTLGHNTLQLDDRDQSASGGPFMWTRHAQTRVLTAGPETWSAEHDGYAPAVHRRWVQLAESELHIADEVVGPRRHRTRLAFHLGPAVSVELDGSTARLSWDGGTGVLQLPDQLNWSLHRGETEPPLGWYSPGFGRKEPATTLIGTGHARVLSTVLRFGGQEVRPL